MKILITNDDGIDAPGIAALVEVAGQFGEPIVAAPASQWSGCGHQTTVGEPIAVATEGENRFRISGTPADCVRLGIKSLAPNVDLVLSGINIGANLGIDIFMSGTVAAAREAMFLGKPAIAISQYRKNFSTTDWNNWKNAKQLSSRVIESVLNEALESRGESLWNINLPDTQDPTPEIVRCGADYQSLDFEYTNEQGEYLYASDYHARPRSPQGDIDVCFSGKIAVSRLAKNH